MSGLTSDKHPCEDFFEQYEDNFFAWDECIDQNSQEVVQSTLMKYELNIVTAESLTAGMIISDLVDLAPGFGSYMYGGFATYDSDAKRQFLGVKVGDVYTPSCSEQMAEGALVNSRAMVGLAVTGKAGPVDKNDLDGLGIVDIAVSLRVGSGGGQSRFHTSTRRFAFCSGQDASAGTVATCDLYKAQASGDPSGYAAKQTVYRVRHEIRRETVMAAIGFMYDHVSTWCNATAAVSGTSNIGNKFSCPGLATLPVADYDGSYTEYGEPSWIISEHTEKKQRSEN